MTRKDIPNLLTGLRIVLGALVFFGLAAARAAPPFPWPANREVFVALIVTSFVAFVVAAATDYLDGFLARRWQVVSPWGAMLDPIADKIAVGAAILGVSMLDPWAGVPGFLMLFREFFVSGLREGAAPLGVKFPVTQLAKWKTAIQLTALAGAMLAIVVPNLAFLAHLLLWVAAALTLWTGWGYAMAARRGLRG